MWLQHGIRIGALYVTCGRELIEPAEVPSLPSTCGWGGAWSISFVINECVSASARSAQESRLRRDGLHAKDGYEAQRLGQFAHECT